MTLTAADFVSVQSAQAALNKLSDDDAKLAVNELQRLNATSIDAASLDWLDSNTQALHDSIGKLNPFALADTLSEAAALFDAVAKARTDALTVEATLLGEIFSEYLASQLAIPQSKIGKLSISADSATAGQTPSSVHEALDTIVAQQKLGRTLRRSMRNSPGHPFNLAEQSASLRERYCLNLQLLLAKLQSIRFALLHSFGYATEPIELRNSAGEAVDPTPVIQRWIRSVAQLVQAGRAQERVITLYRLLGFDNCDADAAVPAGGTNMRAEVTAKLQEDKDATFRVDLNKRATFGLKENEVARVLAVGAVPVFGNSVPFNLPNGNQTTLADQALQRAAFQRLRDTFSFGVQIKFDGFSGKLDGHSYSFPPTSIHFGGQSGWAMGRAADASVQLGRNSYIVNRPLQGNMRVIIEQDVRSSIVMGKRHQLGTPNSIFDDEMKVVDVLIAMQVAVVTPPVRP